MSMQDRYLIKHKDHYYYQRRVPARLQVVDSRSMVRFSVRTRSIAIARERRDLIDAATNEYWSGLIGLQLLDPDDPRNEQILATIQTRYRIAKSHALGHGGELSTGVFQAALVQFISRITEGGLSLDEFPTAQTVEKSYRRLITPRGESAPPIKISEAREIYFEQIAVREIANKSANQRKHWKKSKSRAIDRLIHVVGDKVMSFVDRSDARRLYAWYADRFRPKIGETPPSTNTANQELGSISKFYREYFAHFGEFDRENPFKGFRFKKVKGASRPSIDNQWVQSRILAPGALNHFHPEARAILFVLIETGCRTSEILGLKGKDIILNSDAPYIRVRPAPSREVKSLASERDIPLVGIALEAARQFPNGFPAYRYKSETASPYLLRNLREKELMPTEKHVIYSFRHAFERRMLEAGFDFELRCSLMGTPRDVLPMVV